MKRLAAGASLVTISLSLLVAGRADAQKYPQRTPYDIYDRSRPDRDHIALPPPFPPSAPARPSIMRPVTPGVPTREFKLPPAPPSSRFDAGPYTYAPRYAPRYDVRSRPVTPYGSGYGYGYGYSGYGLPYSTDDLNLGAVANVDAPFAAAAVDSLGRLFIDTEPATAQVVVDGVPAGTVADFRGVGLLLTEGIRRVELRAPGYESTMFDISILSTKPAIFRGDLTPLRKSDAVASPIRRGSDTFYVIPGCYIGNRPPRDVSLPPGCNKAKTKTIK